ncbi:TlyA family rRNA (cytidine-2'-O)-methyltransferase [Lachnospiraceae bacterium oral taxon 500]|nr:TlyA family rRNA (cytidine-2'-O)-methyltransferase [Lachnospiraceae bacterium oral taxon 500]
MKKERLDILLVERGLAASREKAKALIMAGKVLVAGEREEKAGAMVPADQEIRLRGEPEPFVSRGGYKLLKALTEFGIDLTGKTCMDIGASTGGFTDCMLQHGAKRVYSIDVGYGQLAWSLRQDERVIVLEKTNVRYLTAEQVPEPVDFASVDVSFISLTKIIDAAQTRLKYGGEMVCLIKPQFEAGREKVGKNGVVRDKKVHQEVIEWIVREMRARQFAVLGLDFSPIKGPAGNIEYLLHIKNQKSEGGVEEIDGQAGRPAVEEAAEPSAQERDEPEINIENVVEKSHEMVE